METIDVTLPRGGWGWLPPAALVTVSVLGAVCGFPSQGSLQRMHRPNRPGQGTGPAPVAVFRTESALDLTRILDAAWGEAEERGVVPALAPLSLPNDMALLDPETRKRTFLRSIAPHVLEVNREIAAHRRELLAVAERLRGGLALRAGQRAFLQAVCRRYGVARAADALAAGRPAAAVELLLWHVDEVPLGLALAQAAVESAWGASRLAREDNSLFGQCVEVVGRRPSARPGPDGLWYARFASLREGVEAYVGNLNRFWAYGEFRALRAAMRRRGAPLDSTRLAGGLLPYSALRQTYVDKVRAVVRNKEVIAFSFVRLAPVTPAAPADPAGQDALALERDTRMGRPDV